MSAYYNEHDNKAAAWLRELMRRGLIADGEVDERSILDVLPSDLAGFRQCHFFAGIGGWSYALRLAGWPDDREVWTGSCPCQPFSAAGKGDGFADERHLWPGFHWLIDQRRPCIIVGEQVNSPASRAWLDLVSTDLEGTGYSCGATDLPAAGVGAPHIRQRLFWVAYPAGEQCGTRWVDSGGDEFGEVERSARFRAIGGLADNSGGNAEHGGIQRSREHGLRAEDRRVTRIASVDKRAEAIGLAISEHAERRSLSIDGQDGRDRQDDGRQKTHGGEVQRLADEPSGKFGIDGSARRDTRHTDECRAPERLVNGFVTRLERLGWNGDGSIESRRLSETAARSVAETGATRGTWRDADWLACTDGAFRPVEPGTFPLAYGLPARVGRLRGYGNAIVPEVAAETVRALMDLLR